MASPYVTVGEVRARFPQGAPSMLPDERIEALVAQFEGIAERYRGVAFVPRAATHTLQADDAKTVVLPFPQVSTVSTVTLDGVSVDGWALESATGIVYFGCCMTGALVVDYTHGFVTLDPILAEATMRWVQVSAERAASNLSRNILATSQDGIVTRYGTPDWARGRPTGDNDIDLMLNSLPDYRLTGVA